MMGEENYLVESKADEEFKRVQLDTFKNFTILHPKLRDVDATLENAIREPGGSRIIFVIGPSGVGKTTLFKRVTTRFAQQYTDAKDLGQIAVISVEAPAPSSAGVIFM